MARAVGQPDRHVELLLGAATLESTQFEEFLAELSIAWRASGQEGPLLFGMSTAQIRAWMNASGPVADQIQVFRMMTERAMQNQERTAMPMTTAASSPTTKLM
jgi:hypothetical protein